MGFIEQIAPYIQKYAPKYAIKVCSPIIAQAVLESGSGTSELAKNANNYFGLKYRSGRCPTSCGFYNKIGSEQNKNGSYTSSVMQWMKFPDMESGVQGYFDFINISNYANLKGITDPKTYLENIKKDGYATSLKYVDNLLSIINKYGLTKYDTLMEETKPVTLNILTLFANSANYGDLRNTSSIKYLIYHYTANKTDKAKSNANYFKNNVVKASAHYFVDDNDIYQSVDDLRIAYAIGGAKWSDCGSTGGGSMYGKVTNANSISIEMCSTNGVIPELTIQNAVKLGKELMKKYNIPISNVYRHFDVNGKHCPGWNGWYGKDSSKWINLKNKLSGSSSNVSTANPPTSTGSVNTKTLYRVRKSWTDATSQIGAYSSLDNAKAACKNGYYIFDEKGIIVYPLQNSGTYQVKLLDNLNIRKTPNGTIVQVNGAKKGIVYTIVETQGSWGKLKSGAGWISVSDKYVKRV